MSRDSVFDQLAQDGSGQSQALTRVANWLAGDQLSTILHLGDAALAYRLSDQGHEVVVAGTDVRARRSREMSYVRSTSERLPFAAGVFDAVVTPVLGDTPTVIAEHARVLRRDGVVSTVQRTVDESVPWMTRLRAIVGRRPVPSLPTEALVRSGLFAEPEHTELVAWQELDLAALLQLAHATAARDLDRHDEAEVQRLFACDASPHGTLRLRHRTLCVRARRVGPATAPDPEPQTILLDLR